MSEPDIRVIWELKEADRVGLACRMLNEGLPSAWVACVCDLGSRQTEALAQVLKILPDFGDAL